MTISGNLSEFSLPEVFQLIGYGEKTGQLSVREQYDYLPRKEKIIYIWFKQGRIVAAADRLDGQGLISVIQQRGWLSGRVVSRITEVCLRDQPAGLCLKAQGLLEAEQLKLLFSQQVLKQVRSLFELKEGQFQFESNVPLPNSEMTGLSAQPKEVTLASLRALSDWTMLQDKLPEATSGMSITVSGKPQLRLNQLEWQVWEFANGNVPIKEIAQHLQLPIAKIQQVVFRLMVVDLVEEVPLLLGIPTEASDSQASILGLEQAKNPAQNDFSQSFLQNLVGFLKGKT